MPAHYVQHGMRRDCVPLHTGGIFEFVVAMEGTVTTSVLSTPPARVTTNQSPRLLEQMSKVLRVRHYSIRRRRAPCTGPGSSSLSTASGIAVGTKLLLARSGPPREWH